jgi:hypothetical protein
MSSLFMQIIASPVGHGHTNLAEVSVTLVGGRLPAAQPVDPA